jgi:thiamine-monophosphate kinase
MIDISDGLAPETHHICDQSGTGAQIVAADVPIHPSVRDAADRTGRDALALALSGGEDFELLFSIAPDKLRVLHDSGLDATVVGRVTEAAAGRHLILPDGRRRPLAGGYDHFGGSRG